MTFELKTLSPEAVPGALEKAARYRLLNEPGEAESICLDVARGRPGQPGGAHHAAAGAHRSVRQPGGVGRSGRYTLADRAAHDAYERAYYAGIVYERRAKAQLRHSMPGCGPRAYEWLREAMAWYEKAEAIRPAGNDDALLRWNACARLIMRDHHLVPAVEERGEPLLLE